MASAFRPQPDDQKLVDLDWLKSLRQANGQPLSMIRMWVSLSTGGRLHHLIKGEYHPTIEGLNDWISPKPATRGSVRLLATALGVELVESAIALARKGSDQTNNQVVAPGGGGGM